MIEIAVPLAVQFDGHLFFSRIFTTNGPFWGALVTTVYISVLSQTFGTILGLFTALAQRSRHLVLRVLAFIYVLLIRGTPVVVQIFFIYFGANLFLGFDLYPRSADVLGLTFSGPVLAGIVALSINEGAFMSEIIRAGIESIDHGQTEAALSVGMTHRQAMRRIVLPQAARVIVPPLGNEFNNMIKGTSLLSFIGVYELFQDAQTVYSANFMPVEVFTAVAFWYLVLTTIWGLIQVQIERRLGASDLVEGATFAERVLGIRPRHNL